MESTAETAMSMDIIRKNKDLTVSEGTFNITSSELSRKWLKAVEYFTYIDDINF